MALGWWPTYFWGNAPVDVSAVPAGVLSICNQALQDLGTDKIISFSDNTVASNLCNDKWPTVRDMVLRSHPWNCVTKRAQLTQTTKTLSSLTRSGSTATATITLHGYLTGESVLIAGANQPEYNGTFVITVSDVNTFTYTVSGTPSTPATGTITSTTVPAWGYAYMFALPAGCLRLLEVESQEDHKVENGKILTDASIINIKYIYQETDPTKYDYLLVSVLIAAMAAELAYPITRSDTTEGLKLKLYIEKHRLARMVDAQEDSPDTLGDFPLLQSR